MPRRNLLLIFVSAIVSLACYKTSDRNPYGRYFAEVMENIDARYVREIDKQELFEAAVRGMMSKLDENSAFIGRSETGEFQEVLDQQFGGIGIEVALDPKTEQLTVLSPIVGTPAYEAGIMAGDKILKIDGQSTTGFKLKDAVNKMRGRPGVEVLLTIGREGSAEPIEMSVPRAIIQVESVLGDSRNADGSWNYFLEGHRELGYVRLTTFGEKTVEELEAALGRVQEQGSEALILDLRFNPGGLLTAAVKVCDLFIDDGVIVTIRGRNEELREKYQASEGGVHFSLPTTVMVNQYSASAAEIVAACLQDSGRAVVVGSRSYGKGTVQNVILIEGGRSVLKLTTADYWRPSNKNIHRHKEDTDADVWGVIPNEGFQVKLSDEETEKVFRYRRGRDSLRPGARVPRILEDPTDGENFTDPQLKRAMEHLQSKLQRPSKSAA